MVRVRYLILAVFVFVLVSCIGTSLWLLNNNYGVEANAKNSNSFSLDQRINASLQKQAQKSLKKSGQIDVNSKEPISMETTRKVSLPDRSQNTPISSSLNGLLDDTEEMEEGENEFGEDLLDVSQYPKGTDQFQEVIEEDERVENKDLQEVSQPHHDEWIPHNTYEHSDCRQLNAWEKENKIDVVYTWVNGTDPEFQGEFDHWKRNFVYPEESEEDADKYPLHDPFVPGKNNGSTSNRYTEKNELLFSLRSVEMYMPWVDNIFIVTNGQVPLWLNLNNPKIKIITHKEIFDDESYLPVFNSNAIEANFHNIPFKSKKFLYFNDDMLLNMCVYPSDLFDDVKGDAVRWSWDSPKCAQDCKSYMLVNGQCDSACNHKRCNYDNGECEPEQGPSPHRHLPAWWKNVESHRGDHPNIESFGIAYINANSLMAQEFGPPRDHGSEDRKVVAHQAYFMDVQAFKDMRNEYFFIFDQMSRHKFRHPRDFSVQSVYSYYVYEKLTNEEEIFRKALEKFGKVKSGFLTFVEFEQVLNAYCSDCIKDPKFLNQLLSNQEIFDLSHVKLDNSNTTAAAVLGQLEHQDIPLSALVNFVPLLRRFRWHPDAKKGAIKKYKTHYYLYYGHFVMLNDSLYHNRGEFQKLRENHRDQFFCINDDMTLSEKDSVFKQTAIELIDFYLETFPRPSEYEKPELGWVGISKRKFQSI